MAKQQWIFKAYSGIHLGAEVALGPGEYSVGSGYGCDVIIDDSSLSSKHFLLRVSEDGFEWKPFKESEPESANSVDDNQEESKSDDETKPDNESESMAQTSTSSDGGGANESESSDVWRSISPYETVSVGAFRFAYGIVGGAWPPLVSDDRHLSEDESGVSVDVPHDHTQLAESQEGVPEAGATDLDSQGVGDSTSVMEPGRFLWVAVVLAVVILAWVFGDSQDDQPTVLTPTEQVLMIVHDKKLSGVRVTARPGLSDGSEVVRVSGFVDLLDQKTQLEEALRLHHVTAEVDLVAMEYLEGAIQLLANRYKFPDLEFEKGAEPGTLIAKGYVSDVDKWKAFKERVKTDVPSLLQLIDNVETQDIRFTQLKRMIRQHGLDGQIDVWQGKGEFVVSPSINPDMRREWERLMQNYYRRFGDQPPIRQEVIIVEGFDVRSVSLGNPPFVVMSNGQKFTEGARLQNGYLIHRIDKSEVVLKRDGKYVVYPIESDGGAGDPIPDNKKQRLLPESNESKKDVTENYFIS